MINPVIKTFQSFINKKNISIYKRHLNKRAIFTVISIIILLTTILFLVIPTFTNHDLNKKIIEKKISKNFKIDAKIDGKILYKFFPSPRLEINKVKLNFNNSKDKVLLDKAYILLSPFNRKDSQNLKFRKLFIHDEIIKIYPHEFKKYFNYFSVLKENDIILKDCTIFFLDDQKNKVFFSNVYLREKFKDNVHQIYINSEFSNKKINFKFVDNLKGEKNLDMTIPSINASINIIFEQGSTLKESIGESQIKLFDSIFTVKFKKKDKLKIYESFFRNKFFNSKIDGEISFANNFFFDLKLGINQINLRKLLLYYFSQDENYGFLSTGISKKINGKFKVLMKNTNSFIGRIKDIEMLLIFENGDMKIENASAVLPQDSKINFNMLYASNHKDPFLDFSLNFYSENTKKFLRKFNVYNFNEKESSLFLDGKIDLRKNKIKFKNIVRDKSTKFDRTDILNLEKNFDEFVLKKGILGVTDFFSLKKFAKESFD